jgi:hypothetical protein
MTRRRERLSTRRSLDFPTLLHYPASPPIARVHELVLLPPLGSERTPAGDDAAVDRRHHVADHTRASSPLRQHFLCHAHRRHRARLPTESAMPTPGDSYYGFRPVMP